MKDSGIEWLGQIPEHWKIMRLGFFASVKARLGWKGLKAEEYVESGNILLSTPNIKGEEIDFENVNYITDQRYYESPEIMLQEKDVLLVKDGATLGIVNLVKRLLGPATVNSSIAVIRIKKHTLSAYLAYFFKSHYFQNVLQQYKGGMGVPHIFQSDIVKFMILIPPPTEQEAIIAHIEREAGKIDVLISKYERELALLEEYRASLISHAVTGKIDVRGLINYTGETQGLMPTSSTCS